MSPIRTIKKPRSMRFWVSNDEWEKHFKERGDLRVPYKRLVVRVSWIEGKILEYVITSTRSDGVYLRRWGRGKRQLQNRPGKG